MAQERCPGRVPHRRLSRAAADPQCDLRWPSAGAGVRLAASAVSAAVHSRASGVGTRDVPEAGRCAAQCRSELRTRRKRARESCQMSFKGKVVLVTGSTTGIGEACARVFAESDAAVMVCGRNEPRGRKVVQAIRAAGGRAEFTAVDVRAAGACDRLVSETIERLGGLDVLVNNAGILYSATAVDTTDEQWLDTMAVNVNALFYLSRAAIRHMKQKGKGAIVNIASEWGLNGEPNHVAYCA